jgi:hypothetical protein
VGRCGNHWKAVSHAILTERPPLNATQVAEIIRGHLDGITGTAPFPKDKERAIRDVWNKVSPWSSVKRSGRSAVPFGEAMTHFDLLLEKCKKKGLWIVPVGEMEGFCRTVGSHGPKFVEQVLEDRNLESDPELHDARHFVGEIWQHAKPAVSDD